MISSVIDITSVCIRVEVPKLFKSLHFVALILSCLMSKPKTLDIQGVK